MKSYQYVLPLFSRGTDGYGLIPMVQPFQLEWDEHSCAFYALWKNPSSYNPIRSKDKKLENK
jgi:hypothetical protein